MSKNLSYLSGRKGMDDNLFEKLGALSEETGTVAKEDIQQVAREYLMGDANIYGAASFYDFLKPENKNKKVYTCNGSVCKMAGTQDDLKEKLKGSFGDDEIGEMTCLGRCHENHAFQYNNTNYSGSDIDNLDEIVNKAKSNGSPVHSIDPQEYNVDQIGTPVLTGDRLAVDQCKSIAEQMFKSGDEHVLQNLKDSGLRGRGGAGFPIGLKLESCKVSPGEKKYIVCNADEGDPGAFTDRYILEQQPEKLVLGMLIAGYACGAEYGVVYIRAEYPESITTMAEVVEKFYDAGLLGDSVLGNSFNFHFKLIKARGSYICGEETALLSSIEGQRPEVRIRPPIPYTGRSFQYAHGRQQCGNPGIPSLYSREWRIGVCKNWNC